MNFSSRLKELRTHLFGSRGQKHFSDYVGLPQSSLGKYEKNVSPSISAIERIIQRSGCNPAWLLLGEGEMFEPKRKELQKKSHRADTIKYLGQIPSLAFDWLNVEIVDNIVLMEDFQGVDFFCLEVTGDVLAPQVIEGDLCVFEKIHIDVDELNFSPLDPKNHDSIFKLRFYPFNRKIVLFSYDNTTEIRPLFVDVFRKTLILMPINIKYSPTTIYFTEEGKFIRGKEKIDKVEIIAELKTVIRRFNSTTSRIKKSPTKKS